MHSDTEAKGSYSVIRVLMNSEACPRTQSLGIAVEDLDSAGRVAQRLIT